MSWFPATAAADAGSSIANAAGSDAKTVDNAKLFGSLLGPDSHFRLHAGLWFANLGQSLGASLVNSSAAPGAGDVGTGRGALRDVGLALSVKGNEAFFSYLDDRLLAAADDGIDAHVKNGTARSVFRQLVGQLKPNLKDVLGAHQLSFRVVYGKVEGVITSPDQFVGHNNRLFVPGAPDRTWQTTVFSGEVAVDLFDLSTSSSFDCIGSCGYSAYGRYTSFQKPIPLALSPEGDGLPRKTLQDVGLGIYEVGFRATAAFGETLKFAYIAGVGGGYSKMDLGSYGSVGTGVITTEVELRLSYALDFGPFALAPYASFRYVELSPMVQARPASFGDAFATGGPAHAQVNAPAIGYSLWGPTIGLEGVL